MSDRMRRAGDWQDAQISRMLGRIAALEKRVQELEQTQQPTQAVGTWVGRMMGEHDVRGFYDEPDHSTPPLSPH